MIRDSLNVSDNNFTKDINPQSTFDRRERVDKFFVAIPIISTLLNVTFLIFTAVVSRSTIGNPLLGPFKKIYYLILLAPLGLVSIFPAYFIFWHVFKNFIMKVFIILSFLPLLLITITGFYIGATNMALAGIGGMAVEAIYFYFIWSDIRIAVISIKTAIIQLNKCRIKLFKHFAIPLIVFILSLSLIMFSMILSAEFMNKIDNDFAQSRTGKAWKVFFYLAMVCWLYTTECLAAISYIYGAAVFDQTSIATEHNKEDADYEQVLERAFSIAFKSSVGTACLGAFIITLVRLLVSKDKNNKNSTLSSMLFGCIIEFIEFLTAQAYVYTAIHGKGLLESGKMSIESFKTSGLEKFLNFTIVDRVLNIMCFVIVCGLSIGTYYVCKGIIDANSGIEKESFGILLFITIIITIILFQMFYIINALISGHASCQLAVYVEDPDRFKKTHRRAEKFEKHLRSQ